MRGQEINEELLMKYQLLSSSIQVADENWDDIVKKRYFSEFIEKYAATILELSKQLEQLDDVYNRAERRIESLIE